jgi:hypothetical protein
MKEHFGDDELGKRKAFYFLPWHFDFLTRYRYAQGGGVGARIGRESSSSGKAVLPG